MKSLLDNAMAVLPTCAASAEEDRRSCQSAIGHAVASPLLLGKPFQRVDDKVAEFLVVELHRDRVAEIRLLHRRAAEMAHEPFHNGICNPPLISRVRASPLS